MNNAGDPSFTFDQQFEIIKPKPEPACVLSIADLERQLKRLEQKDKFNTFQALGWWLLGIAPSAFFAALAFPPAADGRLSRSAIASWALVGVSLICGVTCLAFSRRHRLDHAALRAAAVEELRALIQKYRVS